MSQTQHQRMVNQRADASTGHGRCLVLHRPRYSAQKNKQRAIQSKEGHFNWIDYYGKGPMRSGRPQINQAIWNTALRSNFQDCIQKTHHRNRRSVNRKDKGLVLRYKE